MGFHWLINGEYQFIIRIMIVYNYLLNVGVGYIILNSWKKKKIIGILFLDSSSHHLLRIG